jgi:hypothetical protein
MVQAEVVTGVRRATGRSQRTGRDKDLTQHGDLLKMVLPDGNCLKTNSHSRNFPRTLHDRRKLRELPEF